MRKPLASRNGVTVTIGYAPTRPVAATRGVERSALIAAQHRAAHAEN
jgi:hypothetical protein